MENDNFVEFLSAIQRWLEKANTGPMTKGNLPPFTPTGDYNDAIFPTTWTDKEAWWMIHNERLEDFDHSSSELFAIWKNQEMGSWSNYDDTHRFFQNYVDREIQFRQLKQEERLISRENEEEDDYSYTSHYPHFKTTLRKGTTAWDMTVNDEVLREYQRQRDGGKPLKPTRTTFGWIRVLNRSVEIIAAIKEGRLSADSDEVKGKIGRTEKSNEEIRKREQLDDPNNKRWKNQRIHKWRRDFIEIKIQNILQWKEFCLKQ